MSEGGWGLIIVSRISLTRPQLAAQVEDLLVRMGQQGQIRGQVTDEALKGLLEQVSEMPCAARRDCEEEEGAPVHGACWFS